MKFYIAAAALAAIVPGVLSMTINTPTSVVQCQPQLISWTDGIAPYYLSIIPGGQPSATPLKSFPTTSANSLTWVVDIAAGTSLTFSLKDSTGAVAYTDTVTIQKGSDSCSGGGSSPASSPSTGSTGTTGDTSGSNPPAAGGNSVAPQAADAATSSPSAPGSTGTTRAASAAGTGSSISAVRAATSAVTTQSVARVATSGAAASASGSATNNTSGAESRFSVGGFGLAGFVALLSAMFL